MKFISFAILLIASILIVQCHPEGRDFVTGVLSTIKGSSFTLNPECLGPEFDGAFDKLIKAVNTTRTSSFLAAITVMYASVTTNCPESDVLSIVADAQKAMADGTLFANLNTNAMSILRVLKVELNNPTKTPLSAGQTIGSLINAVLYNKVSSPKVMTFLASTDDIINHMGDFVDGLLEGLSSVPVEQNQCNIDINDYKPKIISAAINVAKAFKTGTNILEAFEEVYELVKSFPNFENDCHFERLEAQLTDLSTRVGIAKAFLRMVNSPIKTIDSLRSFYTGIENQDYKVGGKGLGQFLSIALYYTTN